MLRPLSQHAEQLQIGLIQEVLGSVASLAQDQFGNYVIQHILEHGAPRYKEAVIAALVGDVVHLSRHKFASNVVEKSLHYCTSGDRDRMIERILGGEEASEPLQQLTTDQFANYVVQRLLETSDERQRAPLLARLRASLPHIKKFTYGKHIVALLEKLSVSPPRSSAVSPTQMN